MSNGSWMTAVIRSLFCVVIAGAACATPAPVVKPTCAISWDRSADYWRVAEYRLTVWKVNEQQASQKTTHVVKAPATQVSCQDIGANTSGRWQATVQACLTDGTCSEASKPMSFQVAEK
jgi:NMD protein affecting ribosome stability and mRNA decay